MTNRVYGLTAAPTAPPGGLTPSQTVGPFFHFMLTPRDGETRPVFTNDLTRDGAAADRITIEGRVLDGDGVPVPDAMIEIWQADAQGRYAHPDDRRAPASNAFRGFGRCPTDAEGKFRFTTIRPGAVPGPGDRPQAPHIAVNVFARGMLKHLVSRIYFAGEAANAADPILALVPADRRATLLASPESPSAWRFDIRLQGDDETVFFDV